MVDANLTVTETITLTKKEVREARGALFTLNCGHFMVYDEELCFSSDPDYQAEADCILCKKLTQFASQGDSEEKGGEDEH